MCRVLLPRCTMGPLVSEAWCTKASPYRLISTRKVSCVFLRSMSLSAQASEQAEAFWLRSWKYQWLLVKFRPRNNVVLGHERWSLGSNSAWTLVSSVKALEASLHSNPDLHASWHFLTLEGASSYDIYSSCWHQGTQHRDPWPDVNFWLSDSTSKFGFNKLYKRVISGEKNLYLQKDLRDIFYATFFYLLLPYQSPTMQLNSQHLRHASHYCINLLASAGGSGNTYF